MNTKNASATQSHQPPVNPFSQKPIEMSGSNSISAAEPLSLSQHFDGALNYIADSLFGLGTDHSNSNSNDSSQKNDTSSNPFAEALRKEQQKNESMSDGLKKQKHLAHHKEMQMTEVFDLEKKKSEEMIYQIKQELSMLVKEIQKMSGHVDQSVQTAVFQGTGETGKYYENFFTQLRNFLILLTKRVKEGNTWMQTFHSKRSKSLYQQNSAQYGSQYQFGQEGQGLTRQSG